MSNPTTSERDLHMDSPVTILVRAGVFLAGGRGVRILDGSSFTLGISQICAYVEIYDYLSGFIFSKIWPAFLLMDFDVTPKSPLLKKVLLIFCFVFSVTGEGTFSKIAKQLKIYVCIFSNILLLIYRIYPLPNCNMVWWINLI